MNNDATKDDKFLYSTELAEARDQLAIADEIVRTSGATGIFAGVFWGASFLCLMLTINTGEIGIFLAWALQVSLAIAATVVTICGFSDADRIIGEVDDTLDRLEKEWK